MSQNNRKHTRAFFSATKTLGADTAAIVEFSVHPSSSACAMVPAVSSEYQNCDSCQSSAKAAMLSGVLSPEPSPCRRSAEPLRSSNLALSASRSA